MTDQLPDEVLRVARHVEEAETWALVLTSAGIGCRIARRSDGWALMVGRSDRAAATTELEAYEEESRSRPEEAAGPVSYGRTYAGFVISALLVGFYLVTGPREGGTLWFRAGSASAEQILRGEVWRAITALTLHADLLHVVTNALAAALFATGVCQSLGPGVGSWSMLLAGGGGNALNALLHRSSHSAVGASTAIFGAVGIMGALQFVRKRRLGAGRLRVWSPVAAALALLGMLGTGERADVLAHLFGFIVGGLLGVVAGIVLPRPPRAAVQRLLALGAIGTVLGCWALALG